MAEIKQNFSNGDDFFIHGEINDAFSQDIIQPFVAKVGAKSKEKNPSNIKLYISSPGGHLSAAFDLVAQMERAKKEGVTVETILTSNAASAASMIAVAGHKRKANKRASHLIHFARIWSYSNNPTMLEREYDYHKWLQAEIVNVYKEYSNLEDIETKLLADNFIVMGSDALLEAGLIDEVI